MAGRRRYADGCAITHALELVGERWALLVVRELLLGPKRFGALRSGLLGISPDVLTQRLQELQAAGIVRRRRLPSPAEAWVYELTAWGAELEPIIARLARWSSRSPSMRRDAPLGVDSAVLSLRALFSPKAGDQGDLTAALVLDGQRFRARVGGERIDLAREESGEADVTLVTDPRTFTDLLTGRRGLSEALRSGTLGLHGDQAAAERFLERFSPPAPAQIEPAEFVGSTGSESRSGH